VTLQDGDAGENPQMREEPDREDTLNRQIKARGLDITSIDIHT